MASDCDARAASELDARGDLDAELAVLERCMDAPPELRAGQLDILVDLGEFDEAKALARAVSPSAPASLRTAADRALALPDTRPSPAALTEQARDATTHGLASRERGDAREAARLLARARHLYRRATGSSGRILDLEGIEGAGFWSHDNALFSATEPASGQSARGARYVLLSSVDRKAGALRMIAAVPTSLPYGDSLVPWPRHDHGFLVLGTDSDLLFDFPALAPVTLPLGNAVFSPDGSAVVIAKSAGLTRCSTKDGATLFDLPNVTASGNGQFLPDGSYGELGGRGEEGHVFLVDAQGKTVFEQTNVLAAAVSPSGKFVAVARSEWPSGQGPQIEVTTTRLDRPEPPHKVSVPAIPTDSEVNLRFEDDVAVLTSTMPPAMMTEFETHELLQFDAATGRHISRVVKEPNSRRDLFNLIQAHAKRVLRAPRASVDFYLHSQSFDSDTASGVEAVVTGIPVKDGMTGSVDAPSLLFLDAKGKALDDVPVTGERMVITNVLLAPGGDAALVCSPDRCWLVDRGRKFAVPANGGPEIYDSKRRWSEDGSMLLGFSEVIDVGASTAEHGVAVDSLDQKPKGAAPSGALTYCWFPPLLAAREVCP